MNKNENSLEIDEINSFNSIINDSKLLINKEIHKFLFFLLKHIFLCENENTQFERYLKETMRKINSEIIKRKDKYINLDYSIENFKNILDFTQYQNQRYAGDIIEGILIMIFSKGFNINKDKSFSKYLYYNFHNLDDKSNYDLCSWFQNKKFKPKELEDLKSLFMLDSDVIYGNEKHIEKRNISVLYNLLSDIYITKYYKLLNLFKDKNLNIYRNYIFKNYSNVLQKNDVSLNKSFSLKNDSMSNILLFINDSILDTFDKTKISMVRIIRPFFISVYIYYQNKISPLMKYIKSNYKINKKYLANIPFEFNLSRAKIEEKFAPVIFAPLRIEPRITKIVLPFNSLGKLGLYELSKTLLFNKNIKIIDYSAVLSHSYEFPLINYGFGLFNNYSVEELNLSYNSINSNCEENIAELLTHFKKLKTLIFINNEVNNGISSFFILLKRLYRRRKIQLENLYLKKCLLDDSSFYELGELLKCKYCKLKKLSVMNNSFPYNIDLLKKFKYNKSLIEVYLSAIDISDHEVINILRILSNSNINYLYINKNKFYIFDNCLRIFGGTKIIKGESDKNNKVKKNSLLINLDISNNNFFWKNTKQIKILSKLIKNTSLECLDIAHILYGSNPDSMTFKKENMEYRQEIEKLKDILENEKKSYLNIKKGIINNQADIEEFMDYDDSLFFENLNDEISLIINNENAGSPVFLRENAKNMINDDNNISIKEKIYKGNNRNEIKASEIEQKLVNYMIVKKAEENLKNLNKELKNRKLIII